MRNIWVWVVGVVCAAGAAIALYDTVEGTGRHVVPTAAEVQSPPVSQAKAAEVVVPHPEETFTSVPVTSDDFILGNSKAPVTIVEYASMTCPHCAHFNNTVLPTVEKEYIDTGKVRLVFRDFPLDRIALRVSMISRCAGRERYFNFVSAFFATQSKWVRDQNPIEAVSRIALLGGMDKATFDACLKNQQVADAVLNQRLAADKTYHVNATPTIIINGDKYGGGLTVAEIRAIIDAKLKNK